MIKSFWNYVTAFIWIITSISKSLVFVEIWLALTGVTNSQIAPFYALDGIFFPAHGRQLY